MRRKDIALATAWVGDGGAVELVAGGFEIGLGGGSEILIIRATALYSLAHAPRQHLASGKRRLVAVKPPGSPGVDGMTDLGQHLQVDAQEGPPGLARGSVVDENGARRPWQSRIGRNNPTAPDRARA